MPDRLWRLGPELFISAARSSALAEAVDEVFGAMITASGPEEDARLELQLIRSPRNGARLFINGLPIARVIDESALAPTLEGTLIGYAVRTRRHCAALHAATIELEGRGVLLTGGKGSGKSTLALHLAREGARYLGDEICFMRFSDAIIEAFPKAVTLKEGSFALFPETTTHLDPIRGRVAYHLPATAANAAFETEPRMILFPKFRPKHEGVEVYELDPGEAALGLVQQSFGGLERDPRMLPLIARLSALPAFALEFPDAESAGAAIAALVAELE